MKVYISKPTHYIPDMKFYLTDEGRLCKITWEYKGSKRKSVYGNTSQVAWNFNEMNEAYLTRVFTYLALGDDKKFRKLYYDLKAHDEVTFPCIQEALKLMQEKFKFN